MAFGADSAGSGQDARNRAASQCKVEENGLSDCWKMMMVMEIHPFASGKTSPWF